MDFFRKTSFNERRLVENLRKAGSFSLEKKEIGTIRGLFRNTLASFFYYPYPLLKKPVDSGGIQIASLIDIVCMKLDAISSRGAKRDFIDVYAVLTQTNLSLPQIFNAFRKKYAAQNPNLMHIKKSLLYFEDADRDPTPKMFIPADWKAVKEFFITEIKKLK